MNSIWSDHVQGVMTLYLSRRLRFDDAFFEPYERFLPLDRSADVRILEIGCGPGALAEALHRRYPLTRITAIDRDSRFISFARKTVPGVDFIEGDAASLPFGDHSFDLTISNTVQEHIEPAAFWGEQRRVLKPGGTCVCLSARKGIRCTAPCLNMTGEEKAFWESVSRQDDTLEKYGVCQYPMSEAEIAASMEAHGFSAVTTAYAVIDLTPDDPKYSGRLAEAMIEADRQNDIEAILSAHAENDAGVLAAVNAKYDERLRLYREGKKQWDTSVSVTMMLRGTKR